VQRCERLSKHRPSIQYGNHDREERCLPRAAPDRCWIAAHFEALIVTESFLFGRHRWDSLSQTGTETAHSSWAIQRTAAFLTSIPNVMGTINQQTSWGAAILNSRRADAASGCSARDRTVWRPASRRARRESTGPITDSAGLRRQRGAPPPILRSEREDWEVPL